MKNRRRQGYLKKIFGIMAFISLSAELYSGEWLHIKGDSKYKINDVEKNILVDEGEFDIKYNAILVEGNSSVDGTSLRKLEIGVARNDVDYTSVTGVRMKSDMGEKSQFKADTLNISTLPEENGENTISVGLNLNDGANFNAKNLNIDLIHSSEKKYDEDNNEEGTTTGIELNKIVEKGNLTKFEADNVKINISNTKNSDGDLFAYGLDGISIYKEEKKYGGDISFVINKDLDIKIEDKSEKQNPDTMNGIYVAAVDTEVDLNNTNIVLNGGEKTLETAGIKIGMVDELNFKTSGLIKNKAKLNIDTTKSPNSVGIAIVGTGGELKADFKDSSTNLKTAGTAIIFKGFESYIDESDTKEDKEQLKKILGNNQIVSLKDAKISTNYDGKNFDRINQNLILVESGVKNATLNLSGGNTEVKATDTPNSYLIYARNNGEITVNLKDGALIEGKIGGGYAGNSDSGKIILNIDNNSTWKLQNKDIKSNVTSIKLKNSGKIDATNLGLVDDEAYNLTLGNESGNLVNDSGLITMKNEKYNDMLYIYGNYEGLNGAKLEINTLWNKDETTSSSDKLYVSGEVKGQTEVIGISKDGTRNLIDGDITKIANKVQNSPNVIEIGSANKAAENTFIGKTKTNGAGEVQLASKIENGKRVFFWTLGALENNEINKNENNSSNNNWNNVTQNTIYSGVVPAYTGVSKMNRDLGYTSIGTLHERKGKNKFIDENMKNEVWFRTFGKNLENKGKNRFEMNMDLYGLQAGYEFDIKYDENGNQRNTGVYVTHTEAQTKFYDKYRAENGRIVADKYTGKIDSEALSIGLNRTTYFNDKRYIDLLAQFSFINNKYKIKEETDVNQRAEALTLSAEIGKSYEILNDWYLEPQSQFVYQHMNLKNFSDGVRNIKYDNENTFKGRLGFRILNDSKTSNLSMFTSVNVWHDFTNEVKVKIGEDKIEEKYARTVAEIGVGMEYLFTKGFSLYTNIGYERALSHNLKNKSYRGTLGLKYSW
nr:autotransporter outer membrane beta-barrel domain-containing protein [Fusobacterium gastrosuis]